MSTLEFSLWFMLKYIVFGAFFSGTCHMRTYITSMLFIFQFCGMVSAAYNIPGSSLQHYHRVFYLVVR